MQAWRALSSFRAERKLSTWLARLAVNEALGRLRRKNKHSPPRERRDHRRQRTTLDTSCAGRKRIITRSVRGADGRENVYDAATGGLPRRELSNTVLGRRPPNIRCSVGTFRIYPKIRSVYFKTAEVAKDHICAG